MMNKKRGIMKEKVHWLIASESNKPYGITTWYRAVGIEKFIDLIEEKNKIVGIIFKDNNIGFILDK